MRPADRQTPFAGSPERVLVAREPYKAAAAGPPVVVKRPRGWKTPEPREALLDAAAGGPSLCLSDETLLIAAYLAGEADPWQQASRLVDLACLLVLLRRGSGTWSCGQLRTPLHHRRHLPEAPRRLILLSDSQNRRDELAAINAQIDALADGSAFQAALDARFAEAGSPHLRPREPAAAPAPAPVAEREKPAAPAALDPFSGAVPSPEMAAGDDGRRSRRRRPYPQPLAGDGVPSSWRTSRCAGRRRTPRASSVVLRFAAHEEREQLLESSVSAQVAELAQRERQAFLRDAGRMSPVELLKGAQSAGLLDANGDQLKKAGMPEQHAARFTAARGKLVAVDEKTWGKGDLILTSGDESLHLAYPADAEAAERVESHRIA